MLASGVTSEYCFLKLCCMLVTIDLWDGESCLDVDVGNVLRMTSMHMLVTEGSLLIMHRGIV